MKINSNINSIICKYLLPSIEQIKLIKQKCLSDLLYKTSHIRQLLNHDNMFYFNVSDLKYYRDNDIWGFEI